MKLIILFATFLYSSLYFTQVSGFVKIDGQFGLANLRNAPFEGEYERHPIIFIDSTRSSILAGGLGIDAGLTLINRVSVSIGVHKERRGMNSDFAYATSDYSYYHGENIRFELDYLTLPISLSVHFTKKRNLSLSIGLTPSKLDSAIFKGDMTYRYESSPIGEWGSNSVSSLDWAEKINSKSLIGSLGIQYDFLIGSHFSIPLGFKFQYDFKTLEIHSRNLEFDVRDLRNSGYYFYTGFKYYFNIKS